MNAIRFSTLLLTLFLGSISAAAQPNKKVQPALNKFLNTEFMLKYRDLRISAESTVMQLQSNPGNLSTAELYSLRSAYDQTATRANQMLDNIKQDFLNAKKLKTIAEFPEMYSDGLRYKLQELSDFYAANFQQALADASQQSEVDGGAIFLLITELIGLTKGLVDYFGDIKREARQYTETYLQEHLVQPYRWRYWDELAGSVSPYEQFNPANGNQALEIPAADGLTQPLQQFNQALDQLPANDDSADFPAYEVDQQPMPQPDTTSQFRYDNWTPHTQPDTTRQQPAVKKPVQKPAPAAVKKQPAAKTREH